MYEYKMKYQGIEFEVSLHENFKKQLDLLNNRIDLNYAKVTDSKILKKIFSYGEHILDFKNDTEFIIIDLELNVGFICSIYTTGLNLEIEVSEIRNKRSLPNKKGSLFTISQNKLNESLKLVV